MPKLLYLLRTSPCFDNPLMASFDDILRHGLSLILNVELDDKQWSQATLLVHMGGLGVRSKLQNGAKHRYTGSAQISLHRQKPVYRVCVNL